MLAIPPTVSTVTMSDNYFLSHSQAQSPAPTIASSASDPTMQSSFVHLHPQHWLGPTSVPWDALGASMGQFTFDSNLSR